jgi:hypothetical protein
VGSSRRHAVPPLLSLGSALAFVLAVAGAARAADPSAYPSAAASGAPSPAASILPGEVRPPGNIQAWRDSDYITPDAPPGGMVEAGFSFWDARQQDFFQPGDIYVMLHPAKGDAAPSDAMVTSDFPGHVKAGMVVPEGGPGDVEVGMLVPACIEGAGCGDQRAPFAIAGIGPPPDARLEQLIGAEILPLVGDTVVDREFPISVNVVPKGDWTEDTLKLPDHLVVFARHPGGQPLSTGDIRPGTQPGTPWTGKLSIPETGDVQIVVAIPRDDGTNVEIEGASLDRQVIQGGRPASNAPAASATPAPDSPAPASSGGIPTIALIGGVAVVIVVVGLVARRLLADL